MVLQTEICFLSKALIIIWCMICNSSVYSVYQAGSYHNLVSQWDNQDPFGIVDAPDQVILDFKMFDLLDN